MPKKVRWQEAVKKVLPYLDVAQNVQSFHPATPISAAKVGRNPQCHCQDAGDLKAIIVGFDKSSSLMSVHWNVSRIRVQNEEI